MADVDVTELNKSLLKLQGTIDSLSDGFSRNKIDTEKAGAGFNKSLRTFTGGFGDTITFLRGGTGSLTEFGKAIKGVSPLLGKPIAAISSQLESYLDVQESMTQSGITFGNNMWLANRAAQDLRIEQSQLVNIMQQNSEAFATFGGTADSGARIFANLGKTFNSQFAAPMRNLGITTSESADMMAQWMEINSRNSKLASMSTEGQAAAAANYIKETDKLAKLTGKSRKKIQDEQAMLKGRADFEAEIRDRVRSNQITPEEADKIRQAAVEAGQAGPEGMDSFISEFLGRPSAVKATNTWNAVMGESATIVGDTARAMREGNYDAKIPMEKFGQALTNDLDGISGIVKTGHVEFATNFFQGAADFENNLYQLRQKGETDIRAALQKLQDEGDVSTKGVKAVSQTIQEGQLAVRKSMMDEFHNVATGIAGMFGDDLIGDGSALQASLTNSFNSIGDFSSRVAEVFGIPPEKAEAFGQEINNLYNSLLAPVRQFGASGQAAFEGANINSNVTGSSRDDNLNSNINTQTNNSEEGFFNSLVSMVDTAEEVLGLVGGVAGYSAGAALTVASGIATGGLATAPAIAGGLAMGAGGEMVGSEIGAMIDKFMGWADENNNNNKNISEQIHTSQTAQNQNSQTQIDTSNSIIEAVNANTLAVQEAGKQNQVAIKKLENTIINN